MLIPRSTVLENLIRKSNKPNLLVLMISDISVVYVVKNEDATVFDDGDNDMKMFEGLWFREVGTNRFLLQKNYFFL